MPAKQKSKKKKNLPWRVALCIRTFLYVFDKYTKTYLTRNRAGCSIYTKIGNVSSNVFGGIFKTLREDYAVTIKDIAQRCGVSVSTVSRVLNKHPDVSEKVRNKVMCAVEG